MDLAKAFNKFSGREVSVTETNENYKGRSYTRAEIADNDATISEIRAAAAAMGLKVRVWLPGTMGTMDYRTDRLNVNVAKGNDNKYRVQSNFRIG
jgi:hypothetical protein